MNVNVSKKGNPVSSSYNNWNNNSIFDTPYLSQETTYEADKIILYVQDSINPNGENNHFSLISEDTSNNKNPFSLISEDTSNDKKETIFKLFQYILDNHTFPTKNNIVTLCVSDILYEGLSDIQKVLSNHGFKPSKEKSCYGYLYEK